MSMSLVLKIGWWKLFALVLLVSIAGGILNLFTFNLAGLLIYPFTYMITVEAYILATDSGEPVNVKSDDIKMINQVTSDDITEKVEADDDDQEDRSDSGDEETEEIKKLKEKQAKELEELKEIEKLKEKQAKEIEDLRNEHSKKSDD